MNAVPFDTLELANGLEQAGLTQQQAKGTAAVLAKALGSAEWASRNDVLLLRTDVTLLGDKFGSDLALLRAEMKADLASLEQRLTIRLATIVVGAIGLVAAIVHFIR